MRHSSRFLWFSSGWCSGTALWGTASASPRPSTGGGCPRLRGEGARRGGGGGCAGRGGGWRGGWGGGGWSGARGGGGWGGPGWWGLWRGGGGSGGPMGGAIAPNRALQQTGGHDSFLRPIAHRCPAAA